MRVHYPLSLFLLLAAGCADDGSDSTYGDDGSDALKGSGVGTDVPDMCAEENMTVEVNGRDIYDVGDPAVGDEWAVRMFCQGILMTGANLLKFTPPTVAVVDSEMTDATFVQSGAATMLLQSGNRPFTYELVVYAPQ